MAYRVRASEMASVPSGRLRWGDLLSERAASWIDALTPKPADLFIASSSQRPGRNASPSQVATKCLRDAVCSQLSDHPILHAAPAIQADDSVQAPGQTTGLTNSRVLLCWQQSRHELAAEGRAA